MDFKCYLHFENNGLHLDTCRNGEEMTAEVKPGFLRWLTEEEQRNIRFDVPNEWYDIIRKDPAFIKEKERRSQES
jgi:hypothetical protein